MPAKLAAEMADIFKSHRPDDLLNRLTRRKQQMLGSLNSSIENVLPGGDAGCRLEFAAEMIAAEIGKSGEPLKCQRFGKMRLDIFTDLLQQGPFQSVTGVARRLDVGLQIDEMIDEPRGQRREIHPGV